MTNDIKNRPVVEALFKAGAHFGYTKTRRHPSTNAFILNSKNKADVINLEKVDESLEKAKAIIKTLAKENKKILFVGTKPEAKAIVTDTAVSLEMPYVAERWVGGIITNFPEIKKRITRLLEWREDKAKGNLNKYTKKERLLIDKEAERLEKYFSGITSLTKAPDLLFVIDSKKEHIAVAEAKKMNVPVMSLSGTDTNIKDINYPIVANDAATSSIAYFMGEIAKAFREGRLEK
jgi:small subunit ribosomal protein S2